MFKCPVCYYPYIRNDPAKQLYDICPSCGIEYGYEDAGLEGPAYYHKQLRKRWIAKGRPWCFKGHEPAGDRNP